MEQNSSVENLSTGRQYTNGSDAQPPQAFQEAPELPAQPAQPLLSSAPPPFVSKHLQDVPLDVPRKVSYDLYNGAKLATSVAGNAMIAHAPCVCWGGVRRQRPSYVQQPVFGFPAQVNRVICVPPSTRVSGTIPVQLRDGQVVCGIPITPPSTAASWTQGDWLPYGTGYRTGNVAYVAASTAVPRFGGVYAAPTSVDAQDSDARQAAEDLELEELLNQPTEEVADAALEEKSAETRQIVPLSSVAMWHVRRLRMCHLFHPTPELLQFLGTCEAPTRAEHWRYRFRVDGQNFRDSQTYPKIHQALGNIGVLCFVVFFERRAVKAAKHLLGLSPRDAVAFKKRKDELVHELKQEIGQKTFSDFCDAVTQVMEHNADNFVAIYRRCQGLVQPA